MFSQHLWGSLNFRWSQVRSTFLSLVGWGGGRDGGWKECELLSRVVIEPNRAGTEGSIQGLNVILGDGHWVSRVMSSKCNLKGMLHRFGASATCNSTCEQLNKFNKISRWVLCSTFFFDSPPIKQLGLLVCKFTLHKVVIGWFIFMVLLFHLWQINIDNLCSFILQ